MPAWPLNVPSIESPWTPAPGAPRRPGADQLRAIYAETTRHRVYDGS